MSFPNELNVMNEVESWKTHRSAASNSMRDEASRGEGRQGDMEEGEAEVTGEWGIDWERMLSKFSLCN